MGDKISSEAGWQEEELSTTTLPDKRLTRRLRQLLDQMSAAPGKPIPAACGDWAATKAAYRFFDNPRVTDHGVLAGHFAATAARVVANEGPILILQDTTEFIYSRAQPGKIGFTKTINAGRYKAGQPNVQTLCGVLMHSSLAVTLTGTPLGLTAVKFWTRTKFKGTLALKRHINPTRVPIETKESYRWLENLRQSIALVGAPERCVHVALTRQRESATIFVATQTARDLRQLARQIGRNEIKSASVAYATRDELSAEQRAKLDEGRAAENARPALHVGQVQGGREKEQQPMASVVEEARAGMRGTDRRTPEMQAGAIAGDAENQRQGTEHQGATPEPVVAQKSKKAGDSDRRGPADDRAVAGKTETRQASDGRNEEGSPGTTADRLADVRVLIAAFQDVNAAGVRRDSLGRSLDEKSIAAAVSRDADVQRERDARPIYLETAYRDPKAATQRLDDIIARDGPTSAARRLSADEGLLGELRGREGFFAGAKAREEREAAHRATAAIGPNIVRTAEFENRAEQSYRGDVEKRMKADAVEVRDVSDRAKAALGKIAVAKDDRERAEAFKVVSADQEVSREIATFRKSIEARFGEDGAREIARATASRTTFEHPSVPRSEQGRLGEAAALYSAARSGEVASRQQAETERLAARESQSTRLKQ